MGSAVTARSRNPGSRVHSERAPIGRDSPVDARRRSTTSPIMIALRHFLPLSVLALASALARPVEAQTTFSNAHPIFAAKCASCHTSVGAGGFNIGASNIATAYAHSQLSSYYSPGQTKGYASLVRILDGSMPVGAGCTGNPALDVGNPACLTASEIAVITAWIQEGQLPPGSPSASSFCPGDGSIGPCPCGNSGAAGRGCANSAVSAGALLASSGTASVSADSAVLSATGMTGATCVFFQGDAQQPPVIVDDGLGCVTGAVIRLGTKSVVSGTSSYPQAGDLSLSVRGSIPPFGGTRYYQCFYRNAVASFCPPSTSNRTNGVRIRWGP